MRVLLHNLWSHSLHRIKDPKQKGGGLNGQLCLRKQDK